MVCIFIPVTGIFESLMNYIVLYNKVFAGKQLVYFEASEEGNPRKTGNAYITGHYLVYLHSAAP